MKEVERMKEQYEKPMIQSQEIDVRAHDYIGSPPKDEYYEKDGDFLGDWYYDK